MSFTDSEAAKLADKMAQAQRPERWHAGWHLKKEIQIPHLLATVALATSAFWYVAKLDQRIALLEAQMQSQRDRDDRQDRAQEEQMRLIRSDLAEIKARLDRMIERGNR